MTIPDITDRLRRWTISTDAVPASDLMDEAADLIDSLRLLANVQATSTQVAWERSTLTDAEREAVKNAADRAWRDGYEEQMDTLRGLLERTK